MSVSQLKTDLLPFAPLFLVLFPPLQEAFFLDSHSL